MALFERFTDRARRVVVEAQQEARNFNHNYIGTEHLLLGLMKEGQGIAARALTALGADLESARERLVADVGYGKRKVKGHIPLTSRANRALELSLREAVHLSSDVIGTEHLLLGLLREGKGLGTQILAELGCDPTAVRKHVLELLGTEDSDESVARTDGGLSGIMRRLDDITARLDVIERRLGIASGSQSDAGQGTESGSQSDAEAGPST